jgi:hypothetical protein
MKTTKAITLREFQTLPGVGKSIAVPALSLAPGFSRVCTDAEDWKTVSTVSSVVAPVSSTR